MMFLAVLGPYWLFATRHAQFETRLEQLLRVMQRSEDVSVSFLLAGMRAMHDPLLRR